MTNRLKAEDARGKAVKARMEVVSSSRLAVVVEDTSAEYPARIDPTFSDANWVSFGGTAGVDGDITAAVVDANGNLYIGGDFTLAGNVIANNIAEWNGSSWLAFGSGLNNEVLALAVSGNDSLYVGGDFTTAGTNVSAYLTEALISPSQTPGAPTLTSPAQEVRCRCFGRTCRA